MIRTGMHVTQDRAAVVWYKQRIWTLRIDCCLCLSEYNVAESCPVLYYCVQAYNIMLKIKIL